MAAAKIFHEILNSWLKYFNFSQAEFARRYGCSREAVRQWVSGKSRNPFSKTIEKFTKVLGITEKEFWDGPPQTTNITNITYTEKSKIMRDFDEEVMKLIVNCNEEDLKLLYKISNQYHFNKHNAYKDSVLDKIMTLFEEFNDKQKESFIELLKKIFKTVEN